MSGIRVSCYRANRFHGIQDRILDRVLVVFPTLEVVVQRFLLLLVPLIQE